MLLVLKSLAATAALAGSITALAVRWLDGSQRWHVRGGWVFLAGMALLVLTWLVSAAREASPVHALAAVVIAYPAWSGLRHARRGDGAIPWFDHLAAWLLTLVAGLGLLLHALHLVLEAGVIGTGLALFGFGTLALILGGLDIRAFLTDEAHGRSRIVNHLGMMIAGAFAAGTSLLVTLAPTQIALILGFALLFLAIHLVIHWSSRVLTRGIPDMDR